MKVLFITQEPWGDPEYGAEARVHGLIQGLSQAGARVGVLVPAVKSLQMQPGLELQKCRWLNGPEYSYPLHLSSAMSYGLRSLASMRDLRKTMDYDVIYVQQLYTAWCGFLLGLSLRPIVLDEHNVEWDILRQYDAVKPSEWERVRAYETLCCRAYSHITIPSTGDKSLLCGSLRVAQDKVSVVPNGVDTRRFRRIEDRGTAVKRALSMQDANIILFMGSYGYIPNRDAANTIMSEICPKTRKLDPRSVFVFTGRRTDKLKVPPGRGIAVLGVVENVVDYINAASICIAPLRFGSGTRLKILEWMACERPIIASKKAAEGRDVEDGRNIIIEDDFSKYPELIAKLNSNPELCESLGRNARKLVIEQHDWRVVGKELARVLRNV